MWLSAVLLALGHRALSCSCLTLSIPAVDMCRRTGQCQQMTSEWYVGSLSEYVTSCSTVKGGWLLVMCIWSALLWGSWRLGEELTLWQKRGQPDKWLWFPCGSSGLEKPCTTEMLPGPDPGEMGPALPGSQQGSSGRRQGLLEFTS